MKVKEIVGQNNPTFKKFLKLLKGQWVKKYGMTFLSGPKQLREVLRDFPDRSAGILLSKNQDIPDGIFPRDITVCRLGVDLFREIDIYGTDQS